MMGLRRSWPGLGASCSGRSSWPAPPSSKGSRPRCSSSVRNKPTSPRSWPTSRPTSSASSMTRCCPSPTSYRPPACQASKPSRSETWRLLWRPLRPRSEPRSAMLRSRMRRAPITRRTRSWRSLISIRRRRLRSAIS